MTPVNHDAALEPRQAIDVLPPAAKFEDKTHSDCMSMLDSEICHANTLRSTVDVIRGEQGLDYYNQTTERHYCRRR